MTDERKYTRAIAEQLRTPLSQMALLAESAHRHPEHYKQIEQTARRAIALLDAADFAAQYAYGQLPIAINPATVGAVLQDIRSALAHSDFACAVSFEAPKTVRHAVVLAHPTALRYIVQGILYAMLESRVSSKSARVVLRAGRSSVGVTLSMVQAEFRIQARDIEWARQLLGKARRPFSSSYPDAAAGLFVADSLSQSLASPLRTVRTRFGNGFGIDLPLSHQISLELG